MYFNIDGLKPVTSESSLDVLYAERNRINNLIEKKEKQISELQKQIYKVKHGENKNLIVKWEPTDYEIELAINYFKSQSLNSKGEENE